MRKLFYLSFLLLFGLLSKVARSSGHSGRFKTIGIHYEGDTSRYENGNHEHYDGNGRLRHPGGVFTDWKESNWGTDHGMDRFFKIESGVVTVPESGLYYIYAQVNNQSRNPPHQGYLVGPTAQEQIHTARYIKSTFAGSMKPFLTIFSIHFIPHSDILSR